MNEIPVGIDFGTTASKMASLNEFGRPQTIRNAEGEESTPTCVFFENKENPIVGREALRMAVQHPADTLFDFKLKLGSDAVLYVTSSGKKYTPVDLTAAVLRKLKQDPEQALGQPVRRVVLTCPANFPDDAKTALLAAAVQAGLEVMKLIPEPSAAALAYGFSNKANQTVLVSDVGGGTSDFSVANLHDGSVDVIGHTGLPQHGGRDVDRALTTYLLEQFEREAGFRPTPDEDPQVVADLMEKTVDAKHVLSTRDKASVTLGARGKYVTTEVSRAKFEELTSDFRSPIVQSSLDLLECVHLAPTDIEKLVLAGGGNKIWGVKAAMEKAFGKPATMAIDPQHVVAYGAAIQAAVEAGGVVIGGRALPAPKACLKDVTAYAVGCMVQDTQLGARNAVVVPRHAPIPGTYTECFCLEHPEQTDVEIRMLQGNDGEIAEVCVVLGSMALHGLPPDMALSKRIKALVKFDGNGMATAQATDLISGKNVEMTIDYRRGVTQR